MSVLSPWNVALITVGRHRKESSVCIQGRKLHWVPRAMWPPAVNKQEDVLGRRKNTGASATGLDGNGPVWSIRAISRTTRVLISMSSPHYPTRYPAESHREAKARAFKVRQEGAAHTHTHTLSQTPTHGWYVDIDFGIVSDKLAILFLQTANLNYKLKEIFSCTSGHHWLSHWNSDLTCRSVRLAHCPTMAY